MDAVDRLLAYEEIRQLASRYAVATDRRDIDALVELFVPDVRVGRDTTGREALHRDLTERLAAIGVSFLNVGTHQIDLVDEDHATGHVYCTAEVQSGDRMIRQAIRYDDTYARRDGRWYFVRRRHQLFYGVALERNPLDQPPADWPENHDGLGTLPYADESWQRFWEGRGEA